MKVKCEGENSYVLTDALIDFEGVRRAESSHQRAESRENGEQRAESREQRTESSRTESTKHRTVGILIAF
jgi:hypothetical protein